MNKQKSLMIAMTALVLLFGLTRAVRAQSALDGFDPNANGSVNSIAVQADGKILIGGSFTTLSPNGGAAVTRNRIARLNPDGTLDASFDPNANSDVYSIAVQADGKILIGGFLTTLSPNGGAAVTRNRIARLNPDGTLDASFDPNANNEVDSIAVQADGKILIGGSFTTLSPNGGAAVTCNRIARLNPDGTLDASFDPNASSFVNSIAVQADGKILIGGGFTTLSPNGGAAVTRNNIARLNPDGTLDASFDPKANTTVNSIAVQADGKILIGGSFTTLSPNGGAAVTRNRIARLNPDGTLDASFDPNANSNVFSIAVQADGKILLGGFFTTLSPNGGAAVTRNRIARLNPDGTLDASFDPKTNGVVYSIAVQADGKILIGGFFTTLSPNGGAAVTRNDIARLETDGRLDRTLNNPNADGNVLAIAVQPDGKILVGGAFTSFLGVTRNRVARLNADGTLDASFDPNANSDVYSIVVQADGKILLGGFFTTVSPNGGAPVPRNRIARLNPDGTLDATFDPNANDGVRSIAAQANGKILLGGDFTSLSPNGGAGAPRNRIARLNADGTLDASFDPNANLYVLSIAVQADGKILLGGYFSSIGGQTRRRIARLNADGTLDASFDPNADGTIVSIAVQADGKILLGGYFNTLSPNGGGVVVRNSIARLNADGTVDATFDPDARYGVVSIAVQADGKILISGSFTTLSPNGGALVTRNNIARLNPDGTLDASFDPNANSSVVSIAVQADGKILAGGVFTSIGGQTRNSFARLTNGIAALQDLAVTRTSITWTLSGASPQFSRVTFESSADNLTYSSLGNGTRSGNTWTLTGLSLSALQNIYVRARGDYPTGYLNGSESIRESIRNAYPPKSNQTITVGTNAPTSAAYNSSFTVAATSDSGLAVSYSSSGACTNAGAVFTMTSGTGTCTVKYDQAGDSNYNAATQVTESVTAQKVNQTITVGTHAPASAAFNSQFTVAATSNSGLAVSYSSSGSCTNVGATFTMTSGTGTCTVKYDQAGDTNYNAATQVTESVTAQKANQTITVGTHAPANATFNSQFTVAATSNSGLSVSYSSSGVCTNSGATFTMTSGTGTCTVKYDQAGDTNYNAATQVTESVTAQKANQTITFGALTSKTFGDADFAVSATASSNLAVSFSAAGNCTISGASVHLSGAGSCTITAAQAGDSNYNSATNVPQSFSIAKANQTITFGALSNKTFGDADFNVSATASSGLTVSFSATGNCTVSGTSVHLSGAGSCTITAAQAGNSNYNAAANVPQSFNIAKANQTITFGALSNKTFGNADFNVSATASSGLSVSFSATGNCTVSGTSVHLSGAGSCSITAAQAGDSNYNAAANVPQSFNIAKAATTAAVTSSLNPSNPSQSVTFTAAVSSIAGTPTGTVQFKDNGTNLGALVNLNGSGVATFSTSSLGGGTHTITADYSGDVNFSTSSGTLSGGQTVNNKPLISFSQSGYTVSEDAHFVDITVNRAGDISSAVNVDYTTDDTNASTNCATLNSGRASARCDFTPAFGTLRFAANETAKTFSVLITQDSHIEGPEMFNLNLSNLTGGAAFISPSSATVTINDGTAVLPANPIDDPATFVRQHYHDFLNREPDQAGLDFWVSNFTQCNGDPQCLEVKRINVSAAFFLSIEFQETGYLVERIYKTAFGDATGPSTFPVTHALSVPRVRFNEFLADTQTIGKGVVVGQPGWEQQIENNKQAFTAEFAQRGNFPGVASQLSNAQFVDTLNSNAGNPLSQSERDQLVTDLNNSSKTRAQTLRLVAEHPNLFKAEFNRAFVLMQFFGYLRRNPNDPKDTDYTGYDFWLTKLNQFNGNYQNAEMVKAFITSIEYRRRFGP